MQSTLINFRGQTYVDCAESNFHMQNLQWANRWLRTPKEQLPGTLTHEAVSKVQAQSEEALLEYLRI